MCQLHRFFIIAFVISFLKLGSLLAQDSLRIIELSGPGESAPVDIPAGSAFTFSLFSPDSAKSDFDAVVGVVTYSAPHSFTYECKIAAGPYGSVVNPYLGWFLGPAKVSLRGSNAGARMQLYTLKLPQGVVAGILSAQSPNHTTTIKNDSLVTPLLGFNISTFFYNNLQTPFANYLSIRSPNGVSYGVTRIGGIMGYFYFWDTPRIRGVANLHNPTSPASKVVSGLFYDDLDSVSPTADFVGPGNATFSLPPEGERSTPIAFYCYKITPANVIRADTSPPLVKITVPATTSISTTSASYALKGSVTDNINPTKINFRVKPPNTSTYGNWETLTLSGGAQTKNWQRSVNLGTKGAWLIQIQPFDAEGNGGVIQTITITKN